MSAGGVSGEHPVCISAHPLSDFSQNWKIAKIEPSFPGFKLPLTSLGGIFLCDSVPWQ